MTTTTEALDLIVTSCPSHGEKVVSDFYSLSAYVDFARDCNAVSDSGTPEQHAAWHARNDHECWTCCDQMVIDPHGMVDF